MAGSYIGIDIGNDSCKLALREGGQIRIETGQLPDNLVSEGRVVAPQTMGEFLKTMRKERNINVKNAVLALDEQLLFFRHISMPPMSVGELQLNLPYEFRDFIEGDPQGYTYDYMLDEMLTSETGEIESMELYAAAIEKEFVDERAVLLKHAGFKLRQAIPVPVALGGLLKRYYNAHPEHSADSIAIIDLGYSGVQATFFHGLKYQSSKHIDMGCREIDEAVAYVKNVDPHVARSYKLNNYEGVLDEPDCISIYEQLCVEITKVINFYNFSNRESDVSSIFLMGGGAAIQPLEKAIRESFDIEVAGIEALLPQEVQDVRSVRSGAMACAALLSGEEAS